jgi:GDPmannose 4,6-dehydratase
VANYREAYGIYACTGILFNHESSLRPAHFVTKKIVEAARRIANGSTERLILGNTKVIRDWGWAPEYVEAMWRMLQMDDADDFVIATGTSVNLEYFAELVFAEFGLDWREHVEIRKELFRPADLAVSRADTRKASVQLKWQTEYKVNDVVKLMVAEKT